MLSTKIGKGLSQLTIFCVFVFLCVCVCGGGGGGGSFLVLKTGEITKWRD